MSSKPQKNKLIKFTLYAKRKQGMSEDDFNNHWTNQHKQIVSEWLAKHGIVRYTQHHTPPSLVQSEADGSPNFLSKLEHLPYDGVAEFVMPDIKCFERAREDPFYKEKVAPDEEQLFGELKWTLGWEEVYIQDGIVVDMPGGDTKAPRVSDDHHMHHEGGDEGVGAEMIGDRH